MELYETIEETAVRELKEETDIRADWLELVTILSGKEYYFEYPNGDKMCTVIVLFKVLNYTGDIKVADNESKQLKFFSLDNLQIIYLVWSQGLKQLLIKLIMG